MYVNPGNAGFKRISGPDYVDKTLLIEHINKRINTRNKLVCISRPRRFGKTYTAKMLTAYYDCSCDSHNLFDDKKISECESYDKHLNQYNVILLDITGFISNAIVNGKPLTEVTNDIVESIKYDLCIIYPELSEMEDLGECLKYCVDKKDCKKFIFIIDEYDALIREAKNDDDAQEAYFHLLRYLFKNDNLTPYVVAAAYLTGILPIKKINNLASTSDFYEYPITKSCDFAQFTGFLEDEVIAKCNEKDFDYRYIKDLYCGYELSDIGPIFNPYSVMNALQRSKCECYWNSTSASDSIIPFINLKYDGLQEKIMRIIIGEEVPVNISNFKNDFKTFYNADDVLTLLIHLGYLTYSDISRSVRIPNKELREHFIQMLSYNNGEDWLKLVTRSKNLIDATVKEDIHTVETIMNEIVCEKHAPHFSDRATALMLIIKYAFIYVVGRFTIREEYSSDISAAVLSCIPYKDTNFPVIMIEYKASDSHDCLIEYIKGEKYATDMKSFAGNIILVGINYDEKTGKHTCTIERA